MMDREVVTFIGLDELSRDWFSNPIVDKDMIYFWRLYICGWVLCFVSSHPIRGDVVTAERFIKLKDRLNASVPI